AAPGAVTEDMPAAVAVPDIADAAPGAITEDMPVAVAAPDIAEAAPGAITEDMPVAVAAPDIADAAPGAGTEASPAAVEPFEASVIVADVSVDVTPAAVPLDEVPAPAVALEAPAALEVVAGASAPVEEPAAAEPDVMVEDVSLDVSAAPNVEAAPAPVVDALPELQAAPTVEELPELTVDAEPEAPAAPATPELAASAPTPLEQPAPPMEADLVLPAQPEPTVEANASPTQAFVPTLDDLPVVEPEPEPALAAPAGFAPSLDDLPVETSGVEPLARQAEAAPTIESKPALEVPEPAGPPAYSSALGSLALEPEAAPLPIEAAAQPSPFARGWENPPEPEAPAHDRSAFGDEWSAEPEVSEDQPIVIASNWPAAPASPKPDQVFASNWDAPAPPAGPAPAPQASSAPMPDEWAEVPTGADLPAFSDGPDGKVELASPSEFVSWDQAPVVGEALAPAEGEFVIESSSAAELANDMRPAQVEASTVDGSPIELANNADFLQDRQLTQTGEAWQATGRSVAVDDAEVELEGEIIQGVVEEDGPPEPADSWGAAVSQPSPAPQSMVVPPLSSAPRPAPQPVTAAAPPPPRAPAPVSVPPLAPAPVPVAPVPAAPAFRAPPLGAAPAPVPAAPPTQPLQVRVATPVAVGGHPPGLAAAAPGAPQPTGPAIFDRSGAVLSGESAPVELMGEHRVILHTLEGQVKRGVIRDTNLCGQGVVLEAPGGGSETLPRERIKALFFMLSPGSRPPPAEGTKVRVTFRDGRQVVGFSRDHQSPQAGFFLVPADNRTNTERIFIYRHGLQSVVPE
ncbi:MAG: hypothetical protein AB1730_12615, partial [Myxococcota bacterium]